MLDHGWQLNLGSSPLPITGCQQPEDIGCIRRQHTSIAEGGRVMEKGSRRFHNQSPDRWKYVGAASRKIRRRRPTPTSCLGGVNIGAAQITKGDGKRN